MYLQGEGSDVRDCVIFLQHCGYLVYTTKETIQKLRQEAGLEDKEMKHVYLMKTQFIVWLKQNGAYAYQKQMQEVN